MNNIGDFAESAFEQGQQVVKQTVKQTQQVVSTQLGTSHSSTQPTDASAIPADLSALANQQVPTELSQLEQAAGSALQQHTPGGINPQALAHAQHSGVGIPTSEQPKSHKDQEQLDKVRQRLHAELHRTSYYNPLLEKIEKLKQEHSTEVRMQQDQHEEQQQQLADLEENKKDQEDVALMRAKTNTEARNIGSG